MYFGWYTLNIFAVYFIIFKRYQVVYELFNWLYYIRIYGKPTNLVKRFVEETEIQSFVFRHFFVCLFVWMWVCGCVLGKILCWNKYDERFFFYNAFFVNADLSERGEILFWMRLQPNRWGGGRMALDKETPHLGVRQVYEYSAYTRRNNEKVAASEGSLGSFAEYTQTKWKDSRTKKKLENILS